MSARFRLAAVLAFTLTVLLPSLAHAQARPRITVEYQNAPLNEVVRNFAAFSGQTIVLASDVGHRDVTASLRNLDWKIALDTILEEQSLIARVDASGAIRIERRT